MLDLFSPLEAKYHCNFFYVFMIIYTVLIVVGVPLYGYSTFVTYAKALKNKGMALSVTLFISVFLLLGFLITFYQLRIFYSMCVKTLKGKSNEKETEGLLVDGPMATIVEQPMASIV